MRNVSNAVKALPDSLAEGMNKVSDNMGRMSERLGQDIKQSILKVAASHVSSSPPSPSLFFPTCPDTFPQVPPLLPKSEIDPEHCRVSAQLDDNVSPCGRIGGGSSPG